ncbi:hypothetical protein SAMN02983003_0771 [Devosia enhydra]|uniref:EAL domain-containing protein n=1 Tax=Devosia enhydra TaxID=665118 RepID=A0A1K2HU78_9HYPH|nr:hypothetical protein [Devosia enhydra]SFZ81910.1 hypothetical protein SAMN02983003_0771 [Devosia enhydra]
MLDELRAFLGRLRGAGEPDRAGEDIAIPARLASEPQPEGDEPQTQRVEQPQDFDLRLAQLSSAARAAGAAVVAGAVEMLGLDDIRAALGDRWPVLADAIMASADHELSQALRPADFYRRNGDVGFIVCFADLGVTEARAAGEDISQRIRAAILRDFPELATALKVEPFIAEVSPERLARGSATSLIEALHGSLGDMRHEAQQVAKRYRASLVTNFNLIFVPAIHARSRVTIYNRAVLETTAGCATLEQFQALADAKQVTQTLAELDYIVFTKALTALHKALKSRRGVIVLIPVNYSTLAVRATQDEYVRLLDMLPPAYQRLVGLEISGVPATATKAHLTTIVERLRPHVKWLAVDVQSLEARGALLGIDGIWALSCNLAGANSADPRLLPRLREFVSTANASRLSTLAHGANSIGAALAACDAGFTCVDGPAVHAGSDVPRVAAVSPPQLRAAAGTTRAARRW